MKLKKIFTIAMIILFLYGCTIGTPEKEKIESVEDNFYGPTVAQSVEEQLMLPGIRKIIKKGYINIAMVPDDIDVFCRTTKNNTLKGLDVDLAHKIADTLGVKLSIHIAKSYSDIPALLLNNTVDLAIAMYSIDANRAASVNLSDPYLVSNLCLTVNSKQLAENTIKNNPIDYMKKNKVKIAVLEGSVHATTVKQAFPEAIVVQMQTQDEILKSVMNGEVFAVFQGQAECICDYIRCPEIKIHTKSFSFSDASDKFCIAVPTEDFDILNFVNAYIKSTRILNIQDVEEEARKLYKY